jgi:DNA-binding NarL/FixJ family response regulator
MIDPVHILVVDREHDASDRLVLALEQGGYHVCGVAADRERALALAQVSDIALVSLVRRGSFDAIRIGRALIDLSDITVLYVVTELDDGLLRQARETGPHGFIFQPFTLQALYGAIEVARPLPVAEPTASYTRELNEDSGLTPREREVLDALLHGTRPPEIARMFFISVHTVRRHAQAVFRKLGVHSQIELMHRFGGGGPRRKTSL